MKKSLLLAIGFILAVSVSAGNLSGYRIGLDPGHGGSDPGASGPTAPHEATLCLRVVNALNSKLQGDGCGTMLTRSSDTDVGLSTRASRFTSYDPYIALSVHLNAFNCSAYGTETWYCTSSGNSYSLASSMHSRMVACMRDGALGCATAPTKGGGTFARGVKQTCWTVINISSDIPATLTEGLFIDNSSEHSYLCSTSGFDAWVMGMLYGCYTHMNKCVNSNIPASPASISPDTENPVIHRGIVVQNDHNSFYAYAYATDNKAVSSVLFPTWTSNNDQDDIKWYEGENGSWTINGQTYNYRILVNRSNHNNETDNYNVHIYAYDAKGNSTGFVTAENQPFTFDFENPVIVRQKAVQVSADSYYAYAFATDNRGFGVGRFPTWTDKDGQDDIIWHEGENGKWMVDGEEYNFRCLIKTSDHNNEHGNYTTHVYIYDRGGNGASAGIWFSFDDFHEISFDAVPRNDWFGANSYGLNGECNVVWGYDYRDGHLTVSINNTDESKIASPWMNVTDIASGTPITWTCYAKVDKGTVALSTFGYERNGTKAVTLNTQWQRISWTGTVGSHQFCAFVLYTEGIPAGTTVYIKDVSIKESSTGISENLNIANVRAKKGEDMPTIIPPTKGGSIFEGYYDGKNGTGTKYYNADGTSAKKMDKTVNTTLYSNWLTTTDPTVTITPASLNMTARVGYTDIQTTHISGYNLTGNISLALSGTNANMFKLSANTLAATGDITITYQPTAKGTHAATLTATATGATPVTMNISATAEQPINDDIVLTEAWNFSEISQRTANWITNGSQVTQDMTYKDGKLYVVHRTADENKILIVNAATGEKTGELNTAACTEGTYLISSIGTLGNTIVACNLAGGGTSKLIVYKWANDGAAAEKLTETTTHGDVRAGDKMSVSGDMTNGKIWFGYGSKVFYYTINNGGTTGIPTVINLTRDNTEYNIGDAAVVGITENADGSFWACGKDEPAARFNAAGQWQESLSSETIGNHQGTSALFFNFGKKKYAAVASYLNKTSTTLAEGGFALINMTDGVAAATKSGTYPANGLGTTRNISFRSSLCANITETNVTIWTLFPYQGAACYTFNGLTTVNELSPTTGTQSKMLLYNNAENLFVEGVTVQTIEMYTITGQKVRCATNSNSLSVNSLHGVYVVVVTDKDNARHIGKIIVK